MGSGDSIVVASQRAGERTSSMIPSFSPPGVLAPKPNGIRTVSRRLHHLAAAIFLLLSLTHALYLVSFPMVLLYHNALFPFLHNGTLHFVVLLLDICCAAACLIFPGGKVADYCILAFIGTMVSYRCGILLTGEQTQSCGCLGVMSSFLGLTTNQELSASFLVIILLGACALPGFKLSAPCE